jgi:aminopeptidase N
MGKSVTRLFTQFQPNHYELALVPNRETMSFTGTVTIKGKKVGRPSERMTLHQKDLKVTAATVTRHDKKGDQVFELERINTQKSFDEVRLHAKQMLYPGEYTLTLAFEGTITRGMTGLYPCFFKVDDAEHALLMTQFESHHAREVFPCVDEPEAKATYDLTLTSPVGESVLANTPIKNQRTEGSSLVTTFETTPRMSSYLLAFVIGELQKKTTKTKSGVEVSAWNTVAQPLDSLDFALEAAKQSIEFFEDYFGVPYPLAKADHVAVPDFSSGAMENWGLITYRERVLLVHPGDTSQSVREYVALVIAHETSHQWFGNLVTMKWWDDLWLNESFANMMEYQAIDALYPDWQVWDGFTAQEGLSALRRDATPGVQAVKSSVHHPDEISTLFDPSIVYAKGGRLLNMMKHYIGETAFRKGLSAYFAKHKYGNTTGADLWESLTKASGQDIGGFMNPWLERAGFPVITVTQKGHELTLTQTHFSDNPDKVDADRLWPVSLLPSAPEIAPLLDTRSASYTLKTDDIARINGGAYGHYIVNYTEPTQREALSELVRQSKLSNGERLMLLNDASMLSRAGLRSYGDVLKLLESYEAETSEPVWDMIGLIISETRRFIDYDEGLEAKIKQLIRKLIAKEYARLGWNEQAGESAADQKLRASIIGLGAYADEPAIIEKSLELFESYKKDQSSLSAELRSIVFGVPVKLQKLDAFAYLVELHATTSNSDLQADICGALTVTRDKTEATTLLTRIKDAKLVKPQDADRWLIYLLRNRYVGQLAWEWMVANWDWIIETYSNDKSYDMLPRYAASSCNTQKAADQYRTFFEPKQDEIPLKRNILIGLEEIANRVVWLERDLESVQDFFKEI